jgi:hypothetical protein
MGVGAPLKGGAGALEHATTTATFAATQERIRTLAHNISISITHDRIHTAPQRARAQRESTSSSPLPPDIVCSPNASISSP